MFNNFINKKTLIIFGALLLVGIVVSLFSFSTIQYDSKDSNTKTVGAVVKADIKDKFIPNYIATPKAVKGIYMSQCVVGTPSFRNKLVDLVDKTELNSIIIDIKDFSGTIGFPTKNPLLISASMKSCGASDMQSFVDTLHRKGIYVIGRITVFQDPYYTKAYPEQAVQSKSKGGPWKDRKGLSFIDVSSKEYWDVVVELSKEAYAIGFDELNYDYVRYPSDGDMLDAVYINPNPNDIKVDKARAVQGFFSYLYDNVKPIGVVMSADLFGMTTVAMDDLGIGQELERTLPYFDFIMPMVYPSHFAKGFHNLGDPNKNVYGVIAYSMGESVKRTVATSTHINMVGGERIASSSPVRYTKTAYSALKMRPWLQDFDYGGSYGSKEVRDQIKATYDSGLTSWILWAPSNKYTTEALEVEN